METITNKGEPFSPVSTPNFSSDNRTRITLFALNLLPTDNASSLSVIAEDGNSQFYQLTVEYVGMLPECDGIEYVIVKLDAPLSEVGDVLLGLSARGLSSNRVRVGIGHVGGGPADDPSSSPTPTPLPTPSPSPGTTHIITGQVKGSDGSALGGVTVNLTDPAGLVLRSTVTTANGAFSFVGLATGLSGSVRAIPTVLFTFSLMTFTNLSADQSAMLIGEPRVYSVSGRATLGSIGLGGVTMICNDGLSTSSFLTDSSGNYAFPQLGAGRMVTITAAKAGYSFANPTLQIPSLDSNRTVDFVATAVPGPTPTPTPNSNPMDPNLTGYPWNNFSPLTGTGITVNSGSVTRMAAGSGNGVAYAEANQTIPYGTGAVSATVASTSVAFVIGLSVSGANYVPPSAFTSQGSGNAGTNFTAPTFGIYVTSGNIKVWQQEATRLFSPYACNSCLLAGDRITVYMDEGTIKYYKERAGVLTLLYAGPGTSVPVVYPLHPQISIFTNGASSNVSVLEPSEFGTASGANKIVWVSLTGTTYATAADEAHATTLALACNGKRPINPGDTVMLSDSGPGTTTVYPGGFSCYTSGTLAAPVTYRAETLTYPPTVVFSNAANAIVVVAAGDYQIWRDVEIRNTSPIRATLSTGSSAQALIETARNNGWRTTGTGNQLINSVIHDTVNGIVSQGYAGTKVYGCITYNNGLMALDGGAGHGLYLDNLPNQLRAYITNTVSFGNYGLQMQFYNQQTGVDVGYTTFDKVVTLNGMFGILGHGYKNDVTVNDSHIYNGSLAAGYQGEPNLAGSFTNNYIYSNNASYALDIAARWTNLTITGNKLVGQATTQASMMRFRQGAGLPLGNYKFSNNTYYRGRIGNSPTAANFFVLNEDTSIKSSNTFAQWQALGLDIDSRYYNTVNEVGTPYSQSVSVRPNTTDVYVYPNLYETGRGHIVIWNWPLANSVSADFSTLGLTDGQHYDVYSIQSGKKLIADGTYRASSPAVSIPMNTDGAPLSRIGDASSTPASTMPRMGVFLVIPRG